MSDSILSNAPATEDSPPENTLDSPGFTYRAAVVSDDGKFEEGWSDLLANDAKYADAAKSVASFKTLPELARSYAELRRELSRRGEQAVVPGEGATPEQVSKYRQALGLPEKAEDYKISKPEDVPDELWDANAAETYQKLFYESNIPPATAQKLIDTYIQIEQGRADTMEAHRAGEMERARSELQKEFGPDFHRQLDLARRLTMTAGVDPNAAAFNDPNVIKALAFAGRNMGEDRMIPSESSGGMNSGAARARDIAQNPQNPLHEKYMAGDTDAVAMVTRLLQGKI